MHKKINYYTIVAGVLVAITLFSVGFLTIPGVKADVVDRIMIDVPVSCSMSASVSSAHTAQIQNGGTTGDIGTTSVKTVCNDNTGYAIYAIGYTGDVEGSNVLTSAAIGSTYDIATSSTVISGTSSWAMKLASVSGSYAPIISGSSADSSRESGDPDFSDYAAVPGQYTRVAYFPYTTDVGASATGSNFTTTYRAYISQTQPAGTYVGKVKYILIHPSTQASISADAITAVFQAYPGDSIEFSDGSTTNTVVFRQLCDDPSDSSTCTFIVTDGEIKNPVNYKGAWVIPMPDGSGGYNMTTFEIQDGENEWISGLNNLGGSAFLGQTVPVYAYAGNAVVYNGNGATSGDMSQVASRFENGEATLIAPNFKKTGYGFVGWSPSSLTTVSSGTIYGPSQTITTSDVSFDSNGTDTFYAVWVASSGNLQNFNCASLASGAVTALTDTRDGNTYAVGKMVDGKCWMMENLRLDGAASLTSANSNNPVINNLGASQDSWCTNNDANCFDQSIINTNNTNIGGLNSYGTALIPYYSNGGSDYYTKEQWYGYGNYYNWYAATAGNGTYSFDDDNDSVSGDICPAGWRLPIGGQTTVNTTGDFYVLTKTLMGGTEPNNLNGGHSYYNGTENNADLGVEASKVLRAYPANFVYSGDWYDSYARDRFYVGYYWSSTAYYEGSAYILYFYSNIVHPGTTNYDKNYGISVRCVAGS